MRLVRDGKIHLKKHQGFTPVNIEIGRISQTIELGGAYAQSSNWTWLMRRDVQGMERNSNRRACFSGLGVFMWIGPLILDGSNLQILTIAVTDGNGNKIYMVSDIFDTPRCPRQYKTFRMQWRKAMYQIVANRVKIVKMPHNFMQKFKVQFNYVPKYPEQLDDLKERILYEVKSRVRNG